MLTPSLLEKDLQARSESICISTTDLALERSVYQLWFLLVSLSCFSASSWLLSDSLTSKEDEEIPFFSKVQSQLALGQNPASISAFVTPYKLIVENVTHLFVYSVRQRSDSVHN